MKYIILSLIVVSFYLGLTHYMDQPDIPVIEHKDQSYQQDWSEYKEIERDLLSSIGKEDLKPESKAELENLVKDLNEIVNREDNTPPLHLSDNSTSEEELEASLKRDYERLGLNYEESKARVESIIQLTEITDPELTEITPTRRYAVSVIATNYNEL